ncbi:MAG: acetoin utilization protein AcuC, partial [Candidatus Omnitrophica bacterium]|nr:acetoin utilization protein AcuC [Candidatus Omnitrophota bacterium]
TQGGYLDYGDTPAFRGVFEAGKIIVGATLSCIDKIVRENIPAFSPVGGLHHAFKDRASGFCVFNDICVGINYLRKKYNLRKILYFDIDAHHGDGVYYSFIDDPEVYIVDFHQRGIFPGTGDFTEKGKDKAYGTKLNIPLDYSADNTVFFREFTRVEEFLKDKNFDFIIFQAGCDSLAGDPLTFLSLTEETHKKTTKFLKDLANKKTNSRFLILGGGGYSLENIKRAWVSIVEELLKEES